MELGTARSREEAREGLVSGRPMPSHSRQSFCLTKTRCCPCCCCTLPRWAWCSICVAFLYMLAVPFIYVIGHVAVYPGAPFGSPQNINWNICNETAIPNSGNRTLLGIRCQTGSGSGPRYPMILFGGNAMNMYDTMAAMSDMLPPDHNWDVFSMSMAGFQYGLQNSAKPSDAIKWSSQKVAMEDIADLLQHVSDLTGEAQISVFGWSLGSSMAAGLAHLSSDQKQVRCVVLGNPFTSLRSEVLAKTMWLTLPWLYLFDEWPTQAWASEFKMPTIVLSSTMDEVIPQTMHKAVYSAIPAPDKLLIEKHTTHMALSQFTKEFRSALLRCTDTEAPNSL